MSTHDRRTAGLCADCVHVRRLTSDRGSRFFLCGRALTDPAYPKYPRLPIVSCQGFVPCPPASSTEQETPSSPTGLT